MGNPVYLVVIKILHGALTLRRLKSVKNPHFLFASIPKCIEIEVEISRLCRCDNLVIFVLEAPVGWDESRATDAEDENADSAE